MVVGLGFFAQGGESQVQPLAELTVAVVVHDRRMQREFDEFAIGVCHRVYVPQVDAVRDGLGLRDELLPPLGSLAQLLQDRVDEIPVAKLAIAAGSRVVTSMSTVTTCVNSPLQVFCLRAM